jgi:hypothetical protein
VFAEGAGFDPALSGDTPSDERHPGYPHQPGEPLTLDLTVDLARPAPSPVPEASGRGEVVQPTMHILRRADGEEMGEFAFWATDGPDGWDMAEDNDHDEDTVYEILACYPVARRKILWSTLCETCDGEVDGCPACAGSGECEPPDAEHMPIIARPAAPSAPVDGPERCHVGIDDGRLVQRLRAETISRAEHLVGPWTVDLIALAADRIEALAGGGGWSPKFETFEQYHAWVAASPTPVDGDSGRRGKAQIMATALHDAGVNTTVSASDNGLLIRVHDRFTPRLLELLALPPVGEERRPVDGGERSQSEQWFVVHHNQIRSLRFGTFPIERLARASIAACTCGPHTLRHTVTTTYTASTTEEFVAAAADQGEPTDA